jgi:hypothetical protein
MTPPSAPRPNAAPPGPGRISTRSRSSSGMSCQLTCPKSASLTRTPSRNTAVAGTGEPAQPRRSTVGWKALPTWSKAFTPASRESSSPTVRAPDSRISSGPMTRTGAAARSGAEMAEDAGSDRRLCPSDGAARDAAEDAGGTARDADNRTAAARERWLMEPPFPARRKPERGPARRSASRSVPSREGSVAASRPGSSRSREHYRCGAAPG